MTHSQKQFLILKRILPFALAIFCIDIALLFVCFTIGLNPYIAGLLVGIVNLPLSKYVAHRIGGAA